ncbi:hypothetical protein [Sulfuriroseicoccus oceanibius]|uniref:UbiA prenyltransferase n=1 Tax=Sulfuriroseicoccus oceanibius TaxID=2707525 RepID=A0A6B3LB19_9BACT|nr:hypothetical protein [Sulfuriroseicoccus oceanibius]QQL45291.1 hypothetical protein G3M56_001510 [Sulfuriroseicoccus oceanibius]
MSSSAPPSSATVSTSGHDEPRLRWWMAANYLNLDAPLVAIVWLALFAACRDVFVPFEAYKVLALAVWCVYTLDHLFDTKRKPSVEAMTGRHRFHRLWRIPLTGALAVAMVVGSNLALTQLPGQLVTGGLLVAGVVVLYLIHARAIAATNGAVLPKELLCGAIFAIGVSLPATVYAGTFTNIGAAGLLAPIIAMVQILKEPDVLFFAALCALNCIAIAVWEWQPDRVNDRAAITRFFPDIREILPRFIIILFGGALAFPLTSILFDQNYPEYYSVFFSCIAASAGLIGIIHWQRHRFKPDVLRVLADVALLTPIAAIPFIPRSIWSLLKIVFGFGW